MIHEPSDYAKCCRGAVHLDLGLGAVSAMIDSSATGPRSLAGTTTTPSRHANLDTCSRILGPMTGTTSTGTQRAAGSYPSAGAGPRCPTRAAPRGWVARRRCSAWARAAQRRRRPAAAPRRGTRAAGRATSTASAAAAPPLRGPRAAGG
eukprot:5911548-Prymnesium_polylepis.1